MERMKRAWHVFVSTVVFSVPSITLADPSELFAPTDSLNNAPNILFILDSSGSMSWSYGSSNRMNMMKAAFSEVMKDASEDINVGLLQFAGDYYVSQKGIKFPISPIEADAHKIISPYVSNHNLKQNPSSGQTVRDYLSDLVNSWSGIWGTPITESLLETALYYRGDKMDYGRANSPKEHKAAHPSTYTGNSNSGTYISPIQSACQKNYAVLMSDGAPNTFYDSNKVKKLTGLNCAQPSGVSGGLCGREITRFLFDQDQSAKFEGKQNVKTFSIGFGVSASTEKYLRSLVTAKGGMGYYPANNVAALKDAFQDILETAGNDTISFGSPSFSVDKNNMLTHGDDVYVAVFGFNNGAIWPGNLRKFHVNDKGELVGKNGQLATNQLGEFLDDAHDLWSPQAAGTEVAKGGAANLLPAPGLRKLYVENKEGTQLGELKDSNEFVRADMLMDLIPRSLSSSEDGWSEAEQKKYKYKIRPTLLSNIFWFKPPPPRGYWDLLTRDEVNVAIAKARGGSSSQLVGNDAGLCTSEVENQLPYCITRQYRRNLIDFARGLDKSGKVRNHMGDMMHSKPVSYQYDQEKLIFIGTNEGYVHAIDADTGIEEWAFMPSVLLKNINKFYTNDKTKHHYGVDALLTIWKDDVDNDGKIDTTKGDKIYLIFGLGHGGHAYYALDISNSQQPKLAWRVTAEKAGFSSLGLTWSKPIVSMLRRYNHQLGQSENVPVLVFGAGYDLAKSIEDVSKREADTHGKNVFIVEARTGKLVWSLDQTRHSDFKQLKHSIAGDIKVLDMDGNGALDRLYFADTGGDVWRVDMDMDLHDGDGDSYDYTDAKFTKIASLGEGEHGDDHRKFFVSPDISLVRHHGESVVLLSLGSGYRMHPLNTKTNDRFYVFRDDSDPQSNSKYQAATNNKLKHIDALKGQSFLDQGFKGWYLPLTVAGEKVMAPAVTLLNKVVFTTFSVADRKGVYEGEKECSFNERSSRAYVLDIQTGEAVADLERDGGRVRSVVMGVNGILDAPQIVFNLPSCEGTDCNQYVDVRVGNASLPVLDRSNTNNNSVSESVDLSIIVPKAYWRNEEMEVRPNP